MTPLLRRLLERIAETGPIGVAEYMGAALGDPDYGYYRRRDPLGRSGDFITAPEISQVFGELIGLWCASQWRDMGCPRPVVVAELGPGRGTLMSDFLRAAALVSGFREAISLHLVETSPVLKSIQSKTLSHAGPIWHEHWSELPSGPRLVVANEFLDALPIRQFIRRADGWHERLIGRFGDRLRFEVASHPAMALPEAEQGAIFEVNEAARELMAFLGRDIERHGGAALLVDYGHKETGFGDTLQAVHGHAYAPVLDSPGEADLSAHVDFEALARAAGPVAAHGPLPQDLFLTRLGLPQRAAALASANPDKAGDILSGCRRLIDAREMGTLFKVMALAPRHVPPPPGFAA